MADPVCRLALRLTPGASADRLDGWDADEVGRPVLKVRVRARPINGQANEALLKLMAKALGLPRSALSLHRGGHSRLKRLEIESLSETEVLERLTAL